jgi:hypothetical protein
LKPSLRHQILDTRIEDEETRRTNRERFFEDPLAREKGKLPIVRSRNDLIAAVAFPMAESKEAWVKRLRETASHLDRVRGRLWPSMQAEINKKKSVFGHKKAELEALGTLRLIKQAGGFMNGGRISGAVTEAASDICRDARVDPLFATAWSAGGPFGLTGVVPSVTWAPDWRCACSSSP